jgi:gliding motility-associated-like protein
MPNAFTPNGDGLNDVFLPKHHLNLGIGFKMIIFNKWGEEIYTTDDVSIGWDGTYKGKPCPIDEYTWKISFTAPPTYNFRQKSPQYGTVMLLR